MGGHAHAYQAFLFQEINLIDQGGHLWSFEWSGLFTPSPLELRESSHEGRETRFMVLIVEPCSMPSSEGILQGKVEETSTRLSLLTYTAYDFLICGARLVFQEKIILEQGKVWRNPKIRFVEVDKNSDLKDGVRVEMDQFHLIVV
jgi:hypothetical protein